MILASWAVALADCVIGPLVVVVDTERALEVGRPRAFHAAEITKFAEVRLSSVVGVDVGVGRRSASIGIS